MVSEGRGACLASLFALTGDRARKRVVDSEDHFLCNNSVFERGFSFVKERMCGVNKVNFGGVKCSAMRSAWKLGQQVPSMMTMMFRVLSPDVD